MRSNRLWALLAVVGSLALGIFVAACGGDDDEDTSGDGGTANVETIQEGVLTVGTDTPYEPFEIGQPPNISGYDIEVMNAIAEDIGLTAEYTDTGFGTIFRDTANGQFDTAAAASTITPNREEVVDFTDPYYLTQQVLLVPADSDIASFDDLSGVIVGAQDGTTGETYANEETDASEVRGYPEGPDAINALQTGQVDAVVIDQFVAVTAEEKGGTFEIVDESGGDEFYGFALAPDSDELREAMNDALATMKEDGTLTEIYQKYFDADPPASVLEGTNEDLTDN